jgi:hypothetical protein
MNNVSSRLKSVLFVISLLGSLVLIAMGIIFTVDHTGAAAAYGVPVSGGADNSWISSAAARDLAFAYHEKTLVLCGLSFSFFT